MTNLNRVVKHLKDEKDRLARQLHAVSAALTAFGKVYTKGTRPRLSAAARARIAAAQRARWAKVKSGKKNIVTMPKKRTISAATRRKIAAAQQARWAKLKAQKKLA
jgi:hypothetical protein